MVATSKDLLSNPYAFKQHKRINPPLYFSASTLLSANISSGESKQKRRNCKQRNKTFLFHKIIRREARHGVEFSDRKVPSKRFLMSK